MMNSHRSAICSGTSSTSSSKGSKGSKGSMSSSRKAGSSKGSSSKGSDSSLSDGSPKMSRMDRRAFAYVVEDAYACANQENYQDKPDDHPETSLNNPPAYQDCVEAPRRLQRQHSSQFPPLPNPTQLASMTSLSRMSSAAAATNINNSNTDGSSSRPLHWFCDDEQEESFPTSLSDTAHYSGSRRELLVSEASSHSITGLDNPDNFPPHSSSRRLTRTSSERSVAEERLRKARDEQQRILEEIQRSSSSKKVEPKPSPSPEMSERLRIMKEQQQLIMERIQGGGSSSSETFFTNETQVTNDIPDINGSGLEHISDFVIQEQIEIMSQIGENTPGRNFQGQQEYKNITGHSFQRQQEYENPPDSSALETYEHVISACNGHDSDRERFIREQQEILDAILRQRH